MEKIEVNLEIANLDQKDEQILVEDQEEIFMEIMSEKSIVKRDIGT